MDFDFLQGWALELAGLSLNGVGEQGLLSRPMTAFFCSRACPSHAISAGLDWGLARARSGELVISGFHSPLERSVMNLLLTAGSPLVAVIGREPASARLPADWRNALEQGGLAVISTRHGGRLTSRVAMERNAVVARLARKIVVAHASAGGSLARQVMKWRAGGDGRRRPLTLLSDLLPSQPLAPKLAELPS